VGHDVPLAGDIPAGTMIFGVPDVDPARRDALVKMLAIDLEWSMNKVSDGQRVRPSCRVPISTACCACKAAH
jgi:CCR4-NOT complex subunit CAF16